MNIKFISGFLSKLFLGQAVFMLPPVFLAFADSEPETAKAFLLTIVLLAVAGLVLLPFSRRSRETIFSKDGFVLVTVGWVCASVFGALPFVFSGEIPRFADAFFESVSGFTTTGASVVADVEAMSRACLYHRSFSLWIGGMGILALILALTPARAGSGQNIHIFKAESPGPTVEKSVPHMREHAAIIYKIYFLLTLLCFGFLMAGKMPLFESVCTALGTAGTGGFPVKNDSIASYSSYLQLVVAVFAILFGINFNLFSFAMLKKIRVVFKDEELRMYGGMIAVFSVLTAANSAGGLLKSFVTVANVITTTGFSVLDYTALPMFSKSLLIILMFTGACAGSTAGGFKLSRILLLIKSGLHNLTGVANSRTVSVVKYGSKPVGENVLRSAHTYLIFYVLILAGGTLVLSLDNFDFETTFTAALACLNNVGAGLGAVGPAGNYAAFSDFSKYVLSFLMLLGRLEIFPVAVLFGRKFAFGSRRDR